MTRLALTIALALWARTAVAQEPPAALRPAVEAHQAGDVNGEASALLQAIDSSRASASHGAAWAMLGDLLAAESMNATAVYAYGKALETGASAMGPRLADALALARSTGDFDALGEGGLAGDLSTLGSTPERSELAVLAARVAIRDGDFTRAVEVTDTVAMTHPSIVDARTLRGIALSNQQAYGDALASLLIAEAAATGTDDHDWVSLNLARAYYGAQNPLRAIEHYVQVSRGSELWLDAHWERAWAHFSVDDMPGTLSLLRAFQTPYLQDTYLAEGDMLRVYALFLMCKFPTAKVELDAFTSRYRPLLDDLDRTLVSASPAVAWADLRRYRETGESSLPAIVHDQFDGDDRMQRALVTTALLAAERDALTSRGADWSTDLAAQPGARHDALIEREGKRILDRAVAMQSELREWLGNADLTRLDILDYETKLLERAAVTGEVDLGDRLGELRGLRRRRGTRVWPATTEVWADEVGYESVRTRSDCREDLL